MSASRSQVLTEKKPDFEVRLSGCARSHSGNVWAMGSAFIGNELMGPEALCTYFEGVDSEDDFETRLRRLNGFFAVIVAKPGGLFAAVDRVRSLPLFYGNENRRLILTDRPEKAAYSPGREEMDPVSIGEFALTGYVTGPFTLHRGLCQLQAGEYICAERLSGSWHFKRKRYYRFGSQRKDFVRENQLADALGEVVFRAVRRLTTWAAGRQIVIPLSGGLDSRLIAISLKLAGYDELLAFTYGRVGNREARVSREVARQLHIPWYFVEYTTDLWRVWYDSKEFRRYLDFAERLTSTPVLQEWPAIMHLKNRGLIRDDAVFVPGHTGDFLAGTHIPEDFLDLRVLDMGKVVEKILSVHYVLTSLEIASQYAGLEEEALLESIERRIRRALEGMSVESVQEGVAAFECWDWQERQGKFIVNSVRAYEFWGHSWYLPLWDLEFVDYWCNVPLRLRFRRRLCRAYMRHLQKNLRIRVPGESKRAVSESLRSLLRTAQLNGSIRRFARACRRLTLRRKLKRLYVNDPASWSSIAGFDRYMRLMRVPGNIYTIVAIDRLEGRRQGCVGPESAEKFQVRVPAEEPEVGERTEQAVSQSKGYDVPVFEVKRNKEECK